VDNRLLLLLNENAVLGADVVSRGLALDSVRGSSDAGVLDGGTNAEVGSGSLNRVLSSNTTKFVLRGLVGLNDLGAAISNLRSLSDSNTFLEMNIRFLVRELRALRGEAGGGVLGTESGSLHAESASSCLVFKTSLIEAELATWAVDAEIGLGGLEFEVNLGSLVLVGTVVLAEASSGLCSNSLLEASNSASGVRAEGSESSTGADASESLLKAEFGTAGGNDGVAQSARGVRGSTIVSSVNSSSVASIARAAGATLTVATPSSGD